MDLEDPQMEAVVANFFDLEKAVAADADLSHEKLAELRKWAEGRDDILPGMTGERRVQITKYLHNVQQTRITL